MDLRLSKVESRCRKGRDARVEGNWRDWEEGLRIEFAGLGTAMSGDGQLDFVGEDSGLERASLGGKRR